jgi:hypothetical protein
MPERQPQSASSAESSLAWVPKQVRDKGELIRVTPALHPEPGERRTTKKTPFDRLRVKKMGFRVKWRRRFFGR